MSKAARPPLDFVFAVCYAVNKAMRTGLEKYLLPQYNELYHLAMLCCLSSSWGIAKLCQPLIAAYMADLLPCEVETAAFEVIYHMAALDHPLARDIEMEALELITEGYYIRTQTETLLEKLV